MRCKRCRHSRTAKQSVSGTLTGSRFGTASVTTTESAMGTAIETMSGTVTGWESGTGSQIETNFAIASGSGSGLSLGFVSVTNCGTAFESAMQISTVFEFAFVTLIASERRSGLPSASGLATALQSMSA
jgi:hypothetical protein